MEKGSLKQKIKNLPVYIATSGYYTGLPLNYPSFLNPVVLKGFSIKKDTANDNGGWITFEVQLLTPLALSILQHRKQL